VKNREQVVRTVRRFNITPKEVHFIKSGVYRLVTSTGRAYCLKRMRYSPERLRWMDEVLQTVQKHGFSALAWRNPKTRAGKTLFVRVGQKRHPYILTPWIPGRTPEPDAPGQMYSCAEALARFHHVGQGIDIPSHGAASLLGEWPRILGARAENLKCHVKKAKGNSERAGINEMLREHGDWLIERADYALDILARSDYTGLCEEAGETVSLCHGDSGPKNFVLARSGPYLIDFETLRIDLRVYDLFRLVRLACKNKGWEFSIARSILDGYRAVSELMPAEYELLHVWLQFPHKACKLLASYEDAGPRYRKQLEQKLEKSIKDEQHLPVFFEHYDDYVNKE
jgi:CotS family spore coat protein